VGNISLKAKIAVLLAFSLGAVLSPLVLVGLPHLCLAVGSSIYFLFFCIFAICTLRKVFFCPVPCIHVFITSVAPVHILFFFYALLCITGLSSRRY
jgi:hypothetical protein